MLRNIAFVVGFAVFQGLCTTASVWAADFGTAEEAKAMLERAVAAVKEDKAKALDMFNNGEGGFKDRDLYVWCANASDGIVTAQPYMNKGKQLRDLKGEYCASSGETIMQNATEGTIKETTYWWPRPGEDQPFVEGDFLHEGRRSDLWCRRLQEITCHVRLWHKADVQTVLMNVRFEENGGHDADVTRWLLLTLSGHLHCDVTVGSAARRSRASMAHFAA